MQAGPSVSVQQFCVSPYSYTCDLLNYLSKTSTVFGYRPYGGVLLAYLLSLAYLLNVVNQWNINATGYSMSAMYILIYVSYFFFCLNRAPISFISRYTK